MRNVGNFRLIIRLKYVTKMKKGGSMVAGEDIEKGEEIKLTVKPTNPKGITREYVNYAQVRFGEYEFTIDFADIPAPDADTVEEAKKTGLLEGEVKYRIACTPPFIERLILALTESYRKYKKQITEEVEEDRTESI